MGTRSQSSSTSASECDTKKIVLPRREVRDRVEAAVRERLVAHGEDLVHDEDVRVDVHGDGEAEAHGMPGEYVFTGSSMKSSSPENATISGSFRSISRRVEAEHDAVDHDVLAARGLRVEARAELDQRRDLAS